MSSLLLYLFTFYSIQALTTVWLIGCLHCKIATRIYPVFPNREDFIRLHCTYSPSFLPASNHRCKYPKKSFVILSGIQKKEAKLPPSYVFRFYYFPILFLTKAPDVTCVLNCAKISSMLEFPSTKTLKTPSLSSNTTD